MNRTGKPMFCVNVELDDDGRINCTFDGIEECGVKGRGIRGGVGEEVRRRGGKIYFFPPVCPT
jgi:hypothetical protein